MNKSVVNFETDFNNIQNNTFSALFPSTNTQKAFQKCMGRSNHLQNGSSYYKKLKRSNKPEIRIII